MLITQTEIILSTPTEGIITLPVQPGQHWPEQGGFYAGILRADTGKLFHIIVPGVEADLGEFEYGGYGEREGIAQSSWDGVANTRELCASPIDHPAAQAVAALTLNGHSDWHLGSRREYSLCAANVPHLFADREWYWASTEYAPNPSYAWIQRLSDGTQSTSNKHDSYLVRPLRRIKI